MSLLEVRPIAAANLRWFGRRRCNAPQRWWSCFRVGSALPRARLFIRQRQGRALVLTHTHGRAHAHTLTRSSIRAFVRTRFACVCCVCVFVSVLCFAFVCSRFAECVCLWLRNCVSAVIPLTAFVHVCYLQPGKIATHFFSVIHKHGICVSCARECLSVCMCVMSREEVE